MNVEFLEESAVISTFVSKEDCLSSCVPKADRANRSTRDVMRDVVFFSRSCEEIEEKARVLKHDGWFIIAGTARYYGYYEHGHKGKVLCQVFKLFSYNDKNHSELIHIFEATSDDIEDTEENRKLMKKNLSIGLNQLARCRTADEALNMLRAMQDEKTSWKLDPRDLLRK